MSNLAMAAQSAHKRIRNFSEVVQGISRREAIENAKLYLEREGSVRGEEYPLGTNPFDFLRYLAKGDVDQALAKIRETNPLPSVTGRFCKEPYEITQVFNRAGKKISLRELERFVADHGHDIKRQSYSSAVSQKVAVIGSGPSGLMAAAELARAGHAVVVFESSHLIGGVLRYGYPDFRYPKECLEKEIRYLQSLGVEFRTHQMLGATFRIEELLKKGFAAIFLSAGAGLPKRLNVPGEDIAGVYYGDEFLMNINLMRAVEYPKYQTLPGVGNNVVVVGAGNTAFDCARTCIRLGCENVTMVVKGTQDNIAVRPFIFDHARQEGLKFEMMVNPVEIVANGRGWVKSIVCRRLDYADPDGQGEWQLRDVPGSEFSIEVDTVIIAIGYQCNGLLSKTSPQLRFKKDGTLWTKKNSSMTAMDHVFTGGNSVDGPGSAVEAMVSAKKAAAEINQYLAK